MADALGTATYQLDADPTKLRRDDRRREQEDRRDRLPGGGGAGQGRRRHCISMKQAADGDRRGARRGRRTWPLRWARITRRARTSIIRETGASGDALKSLQQSMGNVAGQVPEDMGKVGAAIGEVNTRLGLTGPALDRATKGMLDYARLTGQDAVTATDDVASAMSRLKIPADQMPALPRQADRRRAGRPASSAPTCKRSAGRRRARRCRRWATASTRAIALLAQWSKTGGDTNQLTMGMNKALVDLREGGRDERPAGHADADRPDQERARRHDRGSRRGEDLRHPSRHHDGPADPLGRARHHRPDDPDRGQRRRSSRT